MPSTRDGTPCTPNNLTITAGEPPGGTQEEDENLMDLDEGINDPLPLPRRVPRQPERRTTRKPQRATTEKEDLLSSIESLIERKMEALRRELAPSTSRETRRGAALSGKKDETPTSAARRDEPEDSGLPGDTPARLPGNKARGKQPPLSITAPQGESWATVARRKERKGDKGPRDPNRPLQRNPNLRGKTGPLPSSSRQRTNGATRGAATAPAVKKRRLPRTAAVTVTCQTGDYEATMREAKSKISLEALGIEGMKVKRTLTGALNYEIAGPDGGKKADLLTTELRRVLGDRPGVKVARPIKMADIRITGLDGTATEIEISSAVRREDGGENTTVQVGAIRKAPNGAETAWILCPLAAANKIAEKGWIQIGWVRARAVLLEERPLQCYKCLQGGHVRAQCPESAERGDKCYRCGDTSHIDRCCTATSPCCPVCKDLGKPTGHKAGSKACPAVANRGRGGGKPPGAPLRSNATAAASTATTATPPQTAGGPQEAPTEIPLTSDEMEVDKQRGEKKKCPSSPDLTGPAKKRRGAAREDNHSPRDESGVEDACSGDHQ